MFRILSALSSSVRLPVNGLRVIWTITILWEELGVFFYNGFDCRWPGSVQDHPTRILIVADPQILDHRSYPNRSWYLNVLSQFIVDLNVRKGWRAARRKNPHVVVVLGDMMDGGRFAMDDKEYEMYYKRFKSIFNIHPSIPVYYLPGNHDIGLGSPTSFSNDARSRFISHFGPLNQRIPLRNHTLVLIDAPALVEEDAQRVGHAYKYDQWMAIPGGPIEFIKSFGGDKATEPAILFTHIPLWRPDGASCGYLREKGNIKAGTGFGYQNTVGKETTEFVLETIKPLVVFSGDDHDYCEYVHKVSQISTGIKEVSVKSLSMAMGIRRPGFQLLSLFPSQSHNRTQTYLDVPCHLPDQVGIYLSVYVPLIVFSILVLILSNMPRILGADTFPRQPHVRPRRNSDIWTLNSPVDIHLAQFGVDVEAGSEAKSSSENGEPLETQSSGSNFLPSPYPPRSKCRKRSRGAVGGFGVDFLKVAIFPLGLWIAITWRTFVAG